MTLTSGCSSLNSSPAASANGKTVLEPSILIVPESCSSELPPPELPLLLSSSSPHAATPKASAARQAASRVFVLTG